MPVRRHKHERALEHIAKLEAENARLDAEIRAVDPTPENAYDQPEASVGALDAAISLIQAEPHETPAEQRRRDVGWSPVVLDDAYFEKQRKEAAMHGYPIYTYSSASYYHVVSSPSQQGGGTYMPFYG